MRDHRLYLKDIFAAMIAIQEFIEEMDFETFVSDDKTASAVIRKLEIIGEATKNVPEEIRREYPQVPWRQMAGMRDRLIHSYFEVDDLLVWEIVTTDFPICDRADSEIYATPGVQPRFILVNCLIFIIDAIALLLHTKTLDKSTVSCHNPYYHHVSKLIPLLN